MWLQQVKGPWERCSCLRAQADSRLSGVWASKRFSYQKASGCLCRSLTRGLSSGVRNASKETRQTPSLPFTSFPPNSSPCTVAGPHKSLLWPAPCRHTRLELTSEMMEIKVLGENSATGAVAPRGRLLSRSAVVSLSAATSYLSMTHPLPPSLVISLLSRAGRGAPYRRDALEAIFSALYWTLEKQCSNYLGFTTSPCLPLTQMKWRAT